MGKCMICGKAGFRISDNLHLCPEHEKDMILKRGWNKQ